MDISIRPSRLAGSVAAIPSKSAAHRLLICAALSQGETEIYCPSLSKDIEATAACLAALGASIDYSGGSFHVKPIEKPLDGAVLDCGESGSTLRFLLPVICALGCEATIKMHGRLPYRPLSPLWEELIAHGAELSRPTEDTISVSGQLEQGSYSIRADISSQYISGLLFALPLLKGESRLELTGKVESLGYIHMTRQALARFSLELSYEKGCFFIPADARLLSPGKALVEGDWSNAAFWLVASALCGDSIELSGLESASAQGDRAVVQAIADISAGGAVIDCRDIPDLVQVLSVLAAATPGRTEFINAGRLRIKESDRLAAVRRMISALGGHCTELSEGLVIEGREKLSGGVVDGENDHRIVMSAAVASTVCTGEVRILGAQAADKSYPAFFNDFKALGGIIS